MPVYEYRCQKCGQVSEIFSQSLEQKNVVCSYCGSAELEKIFSVPGKVSAGDSHPKGTTCCGREERCDHPPCSTEGGCRRDG